MIKRVALIGLGKQNTKDQLAAIQKHPGVKIVAVCDINKNLSVEWGYKLKAKSFSSVDKMVKSIKLDAAVVAVPHNAYLPIIRTLAKHKISILKEKPLGVNYDEAVEIVRIVEENDINLTVAVQRKHNKIFNTFLEYVTRIGDVFSIHGHYTLNISQLDGDWRRSKELSGGGCVLDMGYHLIDLLVWYFGLPDRISAELGFHNRTAQFYDVEDTAKAQFSYKNGSRRILGSLLLSRIYPEKEEALFVYGTNGTIVIYKDRIELKSPDKELLESIFVKTNGLDVEKQFESFIESLDVDGYKGNYREHLKNMMFIDAIYRSDKESLTISPATDDKYKKAIFENDINQEVLSKI